MGSGLGYVLLIFWWRHLIQQANFVAQSFFGFLARIRVWSSF